MTKLCKGDLMCIKALDCRRWFADHNGKGSRRRKKRKRKKKKKKETTREDIDKEQSRRDVQNRERSETTKYKTQVYLIHQIRFAVHDSYLKKKIMDCINSPKRPFSAKKEEN